MLLDFSARTTLAILWQSYTLARRKADVCARGLPAASAQRNTDTFAAGAAMCAALGKEVGKQLQKHGHLGEGCNNDLCACFKRGYEARTTDRDAFFAAKRARRKGRERV